MSKAIDIGTCFLVAATQDDKNKIQIKSIRDAFLDMDSDPQVKNMMKMSGANFIEGDDKIYIIGDSSVVIANIFQKEARRPLSRGVIAPGELEAERILLVLIKNILGKAKVENETCYYSVPAPPVDYNADIVYHEAMFSKLIGTLGYHPIALNEAAAIVYSNCAKEKFSAIAISCLTPGQKIITKSGFLNIEEVEEGVEVLTKEGLWAKCKPTNRPYEGDVYTIEAYGNGKVQVTSDHKIWVCRENTWQWVMAKEIEEGDLVKQPWVNYKLGRASHLFWDERVTSSLNRNKKAYVLNSELSELLGYFLGNGCSDDKHNGSIGFTYNKEFYYVTERLEYLIGEIFDKSVYTQVHGEGALRTSFFSKGFSIWLRDNCYNEKAEKVVPWDVSEIPDNHLRFFLKGLFDSDGYIAKKDCLHFSNTSSNVANFVYLSLLRLGFCPSFHCRDHRIGGSIKGRLIEGKKECFEISTSGLEARNFIKWMENPIRTAKKAYNYGYTVARINKITKQEYKGTVYDVSVEGSDQSFCAPGIALHNCGAGLTNVCLMYQTIIGMAFSVNRAGDNIDQGAAQAVGTTASRIQSIKEKGINLLDPADGDPKTFREREAICIYYKSLILYVLDQIKEEFFKHQNTIELPSAIPIVLSGGTSLPKNFKEFFEAGFNEVKNKFPINISEVRIVEQPLNAVAQGLLIAAMNYDEGSK